MHHQLDEYAPEYVIFTHLVLVCVIPDVVSYQHNLWSMCPTPPVIRSRIKAENRNHVLDKLVFRFLPFFDLPIYKISSFSNLSLVPVACLPVLAMIEDIMARVVLLHITFTGLEHVFTVRHIHQQFSFYSKVLQPCHPLKRGWQILDHLKQLFLR